MERLYLPIGGPLCISGTPLYDAGIPMTWARVRNHLISVLGISAVFLVLWPFYSQIDSVTAAGLLLLVVLFAAIRLGTGPAMSASVLGVAYLNFFYLSEFDLRLAATDELVALAVFFLTSVMVGQLSARLQRRAVEAQNQEQKITRLYEELQSAFERNTALEADRRAEQFKAALLDAVAHDLRTPLTSIKAAGSALLQAQSHPAGETRELLEIVVEESDRLNHFIEDMIELARLERAVAGVEVSTEPMEEIISAAVARAKPLLAGHRVSVQCSPNLRPVACDGRAVSQVIFSLLENAAKYSPLGSEITVSAGGDEQAVRIAVEDEGAGILPEFREKIFEKFVRYRVDLNTTRPGLGLGLAIAKKIVEAHEGEIRIEDRDSGRGSRFVFTLPTRAA
jgi:two-component system sensor histidine kinase KdpD